MNEQTKNNDLNELINVITKQLIVKVRIQ